ncbi:MAG: ATP-binding protein, partial [Candidatus Omnitrophota bacterium]
LKGLLPSHQDYFFVATDVVDNNASIEEAILQVDKLLGEFKSSSPTKFQGRNWGMFKANKAALYYFKGSDEDIEEISDGASVYYFHAQFFRPRLSIWKNIEKGKVRIENGWLSGWPSNITANLFAKKLEQASFSSPLNAIEINERLISLRKAIQEQWDSWQKSYKTNYKNIRKLDPQRYIIENISPLIAEVADLEKSVDSEQEDDLRERKLILDKLALIIRLTHTFHTISIPSWQKAMESERAEIDYVVDTCWNEEQAEYLEMMYKRMLGVIHRQDARYLTVVNPRGKSKRHNVGENGVIGLVLIKIAREVAASLPEFEGISPSHITDQEIIGNWPKIASILKTKRIVIRQAGGFATRFTPRLVSKAIMPFMVDLGDNKYAKKISKLGKLLTLLDVISINIYQHVLFMNEYKRKQIKNNPSVPLGWIGIFNGDGCLITKIKGVANGINLFGFPATIDEVSGKLGIFNLKKVDSKQTNEIKNFEEKPSCPRLKELGYGFSSQRYFDRQIMANSASTLWTDQDPGDYQKVLRALVDEGIEIERRVREGLPVYPINLSKDWYTALLQELLEYLNDKLIEVIKGDKFKTPITFEEIEALLEGKTVTKVTLDKEERERTEYLKGEELKDFIIYHRGHWQKVHSGSTREESTGLFQVGVEEELTDYTDYGTDEAYLNANRYLFDLANCEAILAAIGSKERRQKTFVTGGAMLEDNVVGYHSIVEGGIDVRRDAQIYYSHLKTSPGKKGIIGQGSVIFNAPKVAISSGDYEFIDFVPFKENGTTKWTVIYKGIFDVLSKKKEGLFGQTATQILTKIKKPIKVFGEQTDIVSLIEKDYDFWKLLVKLMLGAKAGEEEVVRLYDDGISIRDIVYTAITAWGQRIYPVLLSLLGFTLLRQLQEEFGSDFILGGYAWGSLATGTAVEGSDIDFMIHVSNVGGEKDEEYCRVVKRSKELDRQLLMELQKAGIDIYRLLDSNVGINTKLAIGARSVKDLVFQGFDYWLENETREDVRKLLIDFKNENISSSSVSYPAYAKISVLTRERNSSINPINLVVSSPIENQSTEEDPLLVVIIHDLNNVICSFSPQVQLILLRYGKELGEVKKAIVESCGQLAWEISQKIEDFLNGTGTVDGTLQAVKNFKEQYSVFRIAFSTYEQEYSGDLKYRLEKMVKNGREIVDSGKGIRGWLGRSTNRCDAGKLIEGIIDSLREKGYSIELDLSEEVKALTEIDTYTLMIKMGLRELQRNAVKDAVAHDKSVKTKMKIKLEDGYFLRIEVSDEGGGISPENADEIFKPGYTTREGGKGGMGLFSLRGAFRGVGGELRLVKSEVDKGSTFAFSLPVWGCLEMVKRTKQKMPLGVVFSGLPGAGKRVTSKLIAGYFGLRPINKEFLFQVLTFLALNDGIDVYDEKRVNSFLKECLENERIDYYREPIFIDGKNSQEEGEKGIILRDEVKAAIDTDSQKRLIMQTIASYPIVQETISKFFKQLSKEAHRSGKYNGIIIRDIFSWEEEDVINIGLVADAAIRAWRLRNLVKITSIEGFTGESKSVKGMKVIDTSELLPAEVADRAIQFIEEKISSSSLRFHSGHALVGWEIKEIFVGTEEAVMRDGRVVIPKGIMRLLWQGEELFLQVNQRAGIPFLKVYLQKEIEDLLERKNKELLPKKFVVFKDSFLSPLKEITVDSQGRIT